MVQKWVDNLKTIKDLPSDQKQSVIKNIPPDALKEIYHATTYAAVWDMRNNIALNTQDNTYWMCDLEEPCNHKPRFFYFQGPEGRYKYTEDIVKSVKRIAQMVMNEPQQLERLKRHAADDQEMQKLYKEYNMFPNYDPEFLRKHD